MLDNDCLGVTPKWKLEGCSYQDAAVVRSLIFLKTESTVMILQCLYTDPKIVILPVWMNSCYSNSVSI